MFQNTFLIALGLPFPRFMTYYVPKPLLLLLLLAISMIFVADSFGQRRAASMTKCPHLIGILLLQSLPLHLLYRDARQLGWLAAEANNKIPL